MEHLDAYLDEFTLRFNRRKSRSRGKLFYRLLEQAVAYGLRILVADRAEVLRRKVKALGVKRAKHALPRILRLSFASKYEPSARK